MCCCVCYLCVCYLCVWGWESFPPVYSYQSVLLDRDVEFEELWLLQDDTWSPEKPRDNREAHLLSHLHLPGVLPRVSPACNTHTHTPIVSKWQAADWCRKCVCIEYIMHYMKHQNVYFICVHQSVSVFLSVPVCVCPCLCISVYLSVCRTAYVCVYLSVCLCLSLSACHHLWFYLS